MDGPSEASPPMSAPLLLWVILLHWAIGGGFNRGGRTWQHCTGRSEGRRVGCAGREASRQALAVLGKHTGTRVLPWMGCSLRCQGRPQPVCSVLGGIHGCCGVPRVGQPLPGSPAPGFSARVPVDRVSG